MNRKSFWIGETETLENEEDNSDGENKHIRCNSGASAAVCCDNMGSETDEVNRFVALEMQLMRSVVECRHKSR